MSAVSQAAACLLFIYSLLKASLSNHLFIGTACIAYKLPSLSNQFLDNKILLPDQDTTPVSVCVPPFNAHTSFGFCHLFITLYRL